MGTLLRRCVEVRRAIDLSCSVVSGMGPGIHVLDGSPRTSWGRGCFWYGFWHFPAFSSYTLQWRQDVLIDYRLVCEKLAVFPYARYINLNSVSDSLSYDVVRFKIEVGVEGKFTYKTYHNTHATRPLPAAVTLLLWRRTC